MDLSRCCWWHADPEPAAGAADGAAAHAGRRPPAHVDAGGGRPVAGHGEAAAEPRGDPDGGGRPVRAPRRLHAADGHRGGQAQRARRLRHPGKTDRPTQPVAKNHPSPFSMDHGFQAWSARTVRARGVVCP